MGTFITRCGTSGDGVRLAVKDLIDLEGLPTTAGCRALAEVAEPAAADAACMAGARAVGARIVGKTNLHELGLGATGVNPWFGTPLNPIDPTRIPGGSSSGSAVAVADGDADVAFGTDTGGSVRIPAACTGTAGLKTTWGRIPLDGVWPVAASFDTVGPMARDVGGLVLGMQLLEPGFAVADWAPSRVLWPRLRCEEAIHAAVRSALDAAGWKLDEEDLPEWDDDGWTGSLSILAEAWPVDGFLVDRWPDRVSTPVKARLRWGRDTDHGALAVARAATRAWKGRLEALFERYDLLALPTMPMFVPPVDVEPDVELAHNTIPVNVAGVPALSVPVPMRGSRMPASLQLVGPWGSEERLLAAGATVEAAVGRFPFTAGR